MGAQTGRPGRRAGERRAGGAGDSGVRAAHGPARRERAAAGQQRQAVLRRGRAGDGPGVADALQHDRRQPQRPDHDGGDAGQAGSLPGKDRARSRRGLGGGTGSIEQPDQAAGQAAEVARRIGQAADRGQERPGQAGQRTGPGRQRRAPAAERPAERHLWGRAAAQRRRRSAGRLGQAARGIDRRADGIGQAVRRTEPGIGGSRRIEDWRQSGARGLGGNLERSQLGGRPGRQRACPRPSSCRG